MIKVNDRWSLSSDRYGWTLTRTDVVLSKHPDSRGQYISTTSKTYHPTVVSALRSAADDDAKLCESLREIESAWQRLQADFAEAFVE